MIKARVVITFRNTVFDPQGTAIAKMLNSLDFKGIEGVRFGKMFEIELNETDPEKALEVIEDMCTKLLANSVNETYTIKIIS